MSAQKYKHVRINLLPKDAFAESSIGKFLGWALSTGRYIVIFTEMVVILTFLSRSTLDRQLTDLNESILKKRAVLDSYSNIEGIVRKVQAKAEFVETITNRVDAVELLDFLASQAPSDIIFAQLDVSATGFSLAATAYSSDSLSGFISAIKSQTDRFEDVSLDKITTNDKSTGIEFTVRADFLGTAEALQAQEQQSNQETEEE